MKSRINVICYSPGDALDLLQTLRGVLFHHSSLHMAEKERLYIRAVEKRWAPDHAMVCWIQPGCLESNWVSTIPAGDAYQFWLLYHREQVLESHWCHQGISVQEFKDLVSYNED